VGFTLISGWLIGGKRMERRKEGGNKMNKDKKKDHFLKMTDFWDIAPCSLVDVNYTALYPRRLSSTYSPP
jgi:hypothetical protein